MSLRETRDKLLPQPLMTQFIEAHMRGREIDCEQHIIKINSQIALKNLVC